MQNYAVELRGKASYYSEVAMIILLMSVKVIHYSSNKYMVICK